MSSAPSRSRPDPVAAALDAAAEALIDVVRSLDAGNAVVLIDGRSGAGKSSLARDLIARWPRGERVQLVRLDALYPGWDGLRAGVEAASELILQPHARELVGVWQRWDWDADAPAEAYAVDPRLPLIVEGAGILTPDTAPLGDVRVWLESPAASRKRRALARDGDTFRPHWERWAGQEDAHVAAHRPQQLATHVFDVP